jgi:hypothetical protein
MSPSAGAVSEPVTSTTWPTTSWAASLRAPVRISGPLMSIITASSFFMRRLTLRTRATVVRTQAWSAWAMLRRTTLAPALMIASSWASDSVAGPMVNVMRV